jgi:sugar phosphate isomerase/epimerase
MLGYDGALSVEHEDSLMSPREGLAKAIQFLRGILLTEPRGQMTWA